MACRQLDGMPLFWEGLIMFFKTLDIIEKIFCHIIGVLFLLMTLLVFTSILSRYIFHNPLAWSEEIARFMMVWICFLGTAICSNREEHLKMGFSLAKLISPQFDKLVLFLLEVAFIVFLILLIKAGVTVCYSGSYIRSPALQISMNYIMVVIPVTGVAMLIFHIASLYRMYKGENK